MGNTPHSTNALDALVDLIADRVVERLRSAAANDTHDAYYTATTAPCGRRTFLAAARAGAFPSFRRGRRVLARRVDVERWIESQPRAVAPQAGLRCDELGDDELLARAGVARRGRP